METISTDDAYALCRDVLQSCGASQQVCDALCRSFLAAEMEGQPSVGFAHLLDYVAAMQAGRIDPNAQPEISRPAPAMISSDAKGGIAELGFDLAYDQITKAAHDFGLSLFAQRNAYTSGALGYYARRLAQDGLIAFAATNGPALMAGAGTKAPVFCTNPIAFAAPRAGLEPLLIDQASSATAFVKIREAADRNAPLPDGWAIDEQGNPTSDPQAALKGALLAFGGNRGANIALMVEILAACMSGANWSVDAPSFSEGDQSPGCGLFILAMKPTLLDPDFATRLAAYTQRMSSDYGLYIPGERKEEARQIASNGTLTISRKVLDSLRNLKAGQTTRSQGRGRRRSRPHPSPS